MNNSLNLASRPFSNRIVPWTLTVIILFVSIIGLLVVVQLTTSTRREADLVQGQITQLKQREQVLMDAATQVKQAFTSDQQQALPAAHALVERKAFSWSRLLADLESALPPNVKVSRIAVREVTRQGGQTIAQLDLAVFANNPGIAVFPEARFDKPLIDFSVRNRPLFLTGAVRTQGVPV